VLYATPGSDGNVSPGLWKSTNGGVDWDQVFTPDTEVFKAVQYNLINSIAMDAHDPRHLIVSMHAHCNPPNTVVCEAESNDAGATWTLINVPLPGVNDWVAGAGAFILDASTWLFGTYSNGLWLTSDHGKSWSEVTPSGGHGATGGKVLITPFAPAPDGNYYLASMEGVLRSTDGKSWTLIPNSGGREVGFTMGDGKLYAADQFSPSYHTALQTDDMTWSPLTAPMPLTDTEGAPYLAYDSAHHILYSSNWAGGLWRMVTQ
jgi:hypothetical protein